MSHPTTRRTPAIATTALVACALALASCGSEASDERRYGLDETLECPDGYVGWNFQTHPPRTLSSQLQSEAGLLPSRDTLDISAVRCGDDAESLESRQETNRLRQACAGDETCDETIRCAGEVRVSYNCGETDPDDEGAILALETTLAAGDSRALALSCLREVEPEVLPERSACVPRYCHGQERRDEALNCVPDATIPEVILPKVGRASFTPTRFDSGAPDSGTLQMGASYDFDAMLYFNGSEDSAVPENARATVWLADRFVTAGGDETYAFRCVMATLDAGRDQIDREREPLVGRTGVHLELTQEIPATCYHHDDLASVGGVNPTVEADLTRRANVVRNERDPNRYTRNASDDPNGAGSYAWQSTRIFVSYDMEGNTAAAPLGTEHVCAPNPPAFYWDAEDEAFDLWGYLNQRAVLRPDTLGRPSLDSTYEFSSFVYPTVIHVGPTDFTLRTSSVGVTSLPNRSPSVAVDIGWYRDNDPATNVSPYTFNRPGTGLSYTARLYMWPADRVGERLQHPEIASIPLNEVPATTGSVVSRDVELTARTRALFYDPSSALYVDPDVHGDTRAYHVGYCIRSSDTSSGRLFTPYGVSTSQDRVWLASTTGNRIELRSRDQFYFRSRQPPPLNEYRDITSGCQISATPLVVRVDRLNRSQLPVGNSNFSGQATNRTSGDARMSGSSDTDSERACMNADGTPDPTGQSCRETQSGAAMGAGNLGRSFYSYDLDLTRMNQSAQAAMTGNVLGFMAIDPMMDGNSSSATPTPGDETTPVTLTLTPPWNSIRDALNTATGTPPGSVLKQQWQTGSYAGVDGLGLAIGYKQKIQIGPIPGEIILSASAGVALAALITLQAAPSAADAYPCIGSTQCVQVAAEKATLEAAALDCYVRGGRLAEPSSAAEGSALQAATSAHSGTYYWAGAQLAYGHPNPQCLGDGFSRSRCMGAMRTSYRWLANDAELATHIGAQVANYTPPSTTSVSTLQTLAPNAGGLVYAPGSQTLASANATDTHHYACAFEPAAREVFFRSSVGLKVAAGAGISLQFCVPSEDIGFCLEGTLNFVTLALQPTVTRTDRVLFGGGSPIAYRAHTRREVPWSLTVLDGAIYAKANFYFVSFSWPIVTFPGFRVAGGYLVEPIDTAVHRGL